MNTHKLIHFNPYNGLPLEPHTIRSAVQWRISPQGMKSEPWLFNPWTGRKRDSADIEDDPQYECAEMCGPEPEQFTPAGDPQYGMLYAVLMEAFAQASSGKGKERHANDLPFLEQKIFSINRQLGSVDGILYQVVKKTIESKKLPPDRACAELMGAIVYAAAGILFIREQSL